MGQIKDKLIADDYTIMARTFFQIREYDKVKARCYLLNHINGAPELYNTEWYEEEYDNGHKITQFRVIHKLDILGRLNVRRIKNKTFILNLKDKKFYIKTYTNNGKKESSFRRLKWGDLDGITKDCLREYDSRFNALFKLLDSIGNSVSWVTLDMLFFGDIKNIRQIYECSHANYRNPLLTKLNLTHHLSGEIINKYLYKIKNLGSDTIAILKKHNEIIATALSYGIKEIDLKDDDLVKTLEKFNTDLVDFTKYSEPLKIPTKEEFVKLLSDVDEVTLVDEVTDELVSSKVYNNEAEAYFLYKDQYYSIYRNYRNNYSINGPNGGVSDELRNKFKMTELNSIEFTFEHSILPF